jgi:serine/threonine-protein kinase
VFLRQRYALKRLLPEARDAGDTVDRFLREAQVAARLSGEHVVRVHDFDVLPDGTAALVMEYVEGTDLCRLVEDSGPLPADVAVGYVLQACVAVAEAHALGIVHRDIKPANLLLTRAADGSARVKVTDFGVAKLRRGNTLDEMQCTQSSVIVGTPLYMPPEQLRGDAVDPRTDVWALGMTLRELIVGEPAYLANTVPELCGMILNDDEVPPMPRALPRGLTDAISGALQKEADRRHEDVAVFARALAPFAPKWAAAAADHAARILRRPDLIPDVESPRSSSRVARALSFLKSI